MSAEQRSCVHIRPCLGRLFDESGIAVVMAIAVMLVLTVLVTSALAYTSSDSRNASYGTSAQKAYAAAEAGLNDALAAVQVAGSDTTKMTAQPTSPSAGGTVTNLDGGATVRWGGSYDAASQTWTLKAISSVPNPTGPTGSVVTRTLSQTATITPPPYSFVALNTSCDNHTLLVETGGQLTVTNAMYIDSCNSPQDAFDIFGTGGNITDPKGITVVGGWETHNGSTVTSNGTLCPLSNSSAPITATQPAGCPVTGQSVLADPLAPKLTTSPTLGTPACSGATVTQGQAYNPAVTLNTGPGGLTATATSVPVQWTSGSDPIAVNDVLLIDSEQMRVTAITPGSGPGGTTKATLTVTRAYNSTTGATHANGAAVTRVVSGVSGTAAVPAPCVYTSGSVTLQPGTYYGGICIGSLSASGCDNGNCVTTGTTGAYSPAVALSTGGTAYNPAVTLSTGGTAYNPALTLNTGPGGLTAAATSVPVKWAAGSDPVAVGDAILIDTEQMHVTAVTANTATTATLTVTRAYNGTTAATHSNGKAVAKATSGATGGAITSSATVVPVAWPSGSDPIAVGDTILVDTEQMRVTAVTAVTTTSAALTVTRGYNGTTAATHANNAAVVQATAGTTGGAITASATVVPVAWSSGSDPIAVGDVILVDSEQMSVTGIAAVTSTSAALTVTRGYNSTAAATHNNGASVSKYTTPSHVDATMADGTYIIAGGGLRVCGASTLSAPHVLIYNTQDPSNTSGYGALDQFELNTTGTVNIGPPADGPYEGLTYWQDSSLALDSADSCNSRNNHQQSSQAQINNYDIALESTASTGANGTLGSISGSMYAPANRADFVDELSGTANLAVLSSCILIDGGNSTFAFNPTGLFGTNWVLGPQAG